MRQAPLPTESLPPVFGELAIAIAFGVERPIPVLRRHFGKLVDGYAFEFLELVVVHDRVSLV
jgi:hypothetical protein